MNEPVERVSVLHFEPGGEPRPAMRGLLQESPLTIRVAGHSDIALMRTPGADRELVVGFLLTEGFIRGMADIATLEECRVDQAGGHEPAKPPADAIRVTLVAEAPAAAAERRMLVASSCSLCGREQIEAILHEMAPLEDDTRCPVKVLFDVPDRMRDAQRLFQRTGASHAAALFDVSGNILVVREDIGRHNALDKVLTGRPLAACGAMLSGRASFEMVAKSARARVPLVAAVSAASALAVTAAEKLTLTLCGFVRGKEVTCYAHPERLVK